MRHVLASLILRNVIFLVYGLGKRRFVFLVKSGGICSILSKNPKTSINISRYGALHESQEWE